MSETWSAISPDWLSAITRVGGDSFRFVEKVDVVSITGLTPSTARSELEALSSTLSGGWAIVSYRDGAEVVYGPPEVWVEGGVLEAECYSASGITYRLSPDPDGTLSLFGYATDLRKLMADQDRWHFQSSLYGLLAQAREFASVRKGGSVSYDIYWQIAGEFGLRERLALLTDVKG